MKTKPTSTLPFLLLAALLLVSCRSTGAAPAPGTSQPASTLITPPGPSPAAALPASPTAAPTAMPAPPTLAPTPSTPPATNPLTALRPADHLQGNCLNWPAEPISKENQVRLRTSLETGDAAIDFSLQDPAGQSYSLHELLASRPVLLVLGGYT